jgi:hypothetical protein
MLAATVAERAFCAAMDLGVEDLLRREALRWRAE